MQNFSGIWVPLITPFHNGEIDTAALQRLASQLICAGVSGLVVCGSTGEAAALSHHEQLMVLDSVLETAPKNFPVAMGLAGNNMPALASMQKQIQQRQIAGLLVPPPYYIRPAQSGIVEYFYAIADAASVPVIVYNIPYRTGVRIELETMRLLARHNLITAVKDCAGDPLMTMNLIADRQLQVLAGEDVQLLATLCLGGAGAIAASAHIRADLFVRVVHHVNAGELGAARTLFYRLLPLMQLLFADANPALLKAALSVLGMASDELRAPMQAAPEPLRERLRQQLQQLQHLEH